MKRLALLVLGILAASTSTFAQATPEVDKALIAAPTPQKEGATVIKWKVADYTYDTVRKGTNNLVCYDLSGLPGQQPFSIECTSVNNLARVAQNLKAEAAGDKAKTKALLDAAEKDGTRVKPEYGSIWWHAAGDAANPRKHMTIAVPGATSASLGGIPDNPKQGGLWLMDAGTSTAHLMVPGN
jgi:hypothetical protein